MSAIHLTKAAFEQEVLRAGVALVDFWAGWCGPCKMVAPVIDELADELDGKALVGKIDVDAEMDVAQSFGIMSIPTILIFKDGKEAERLVGVMPQAAYLDAVNKHL